MDLVAGRLQNASKMFITGDILVNNKPIDFSAFQKVSAYVQQESCLPITETVREVLMFNAQLRLPGSMTNAQRRERVESILTELVSPSTCFLDFGVRLKVDVMREEAHSSCIMLEHARVAAMAQHSCCSEQCDSCCSEQHECRGNIIKSKARKLGVRSHKSEQNGIDREQCSSVGGHLHEYILELCANSSQVFDQVQHVL
jgi:hypothetical protein